jgi:PAS domain S-box-containing protein
MMPEDILRASDQDLRLILDSIPAFLYTTTATGSLEFANQDVLEYFGKTLEDLRGWTISDAVHPDDVPQVLASWMRSVETGQPYDVDHRLLRTDGAYRWFHATGLPFRDFEGSIVRWNVLLTDIHQLKTAEEKLRRSEAASLEAQRLSHTGNWIHDIASDTVIVLPHIREMFGIKPGEDASPRQFLFSRLHPEDRERVQDTFERSESQKIDFQVDYRLILPDGTVRYRYSTGHPVFNDSGELAAYIGTAVDLTEQWQARTALEKAFEEINLLKDRLDDENLALRASEERLNLIVDGIAGLVAIMSSAGEVEFVNRPGLEYFGKTVAELKGWAISDAVHPEDLPQAIGEWRRSVETGEQYDVDHRLRGADGAYRWFRAHGLPLRDAGGRIVRWYVLLTDIDDRKRAEEKLRRSEESLLEAQRLSHTGSWSHDISLGTVKVSPEVRRIYGLTPDDDTFTTEFLLGRNHPEDAKRIRQLFERCELEKANYDADYRIVLPDETIKHVHAIGHPVLNESGQLVEFVGTVVDVTEQWRARAALEKAFEEIKHLKERLQDENVSLETQNEYLQEEIKQAHNFDEIIGHSAALNSVLDQVRLVAPTDSTVLILGETGTGKELIARAIHSASTRRERALIKVNCAALPAGLIESELFGHEKGAFTGATDKRIGRFELANGGTIFLDEIGELPPEVQIKLLRVLQEREFERIGSSGTVRVDIRVIAATNRDFSQAVAQGKFRRDLFYRLNVFPILIPPLRQRPEDIPMLVHFFVRGCAGRIGRRIEGIPAATMTRLTAYPWPGNIRELENVIERAVILSRGPDLQLAPELIPAIAVTGDHTSKADPANHTDVATSGDRSLAQAEKERILDVLKQTHWRIAGPNGAAAILKLNPSTLRSRMEKLGVERSRDGIP